MVIPVMPASVRASLTASNRPGWIIASTFVIFFPVSVAGQLPKAIAYLPHPISGAPVGLTGNIRCMFRGAHHSFDASQRQFLCHAARCAQGRNDVLRVS